MDPGAPDVPRTQGIDLGDLGLSADFITDNDVLYENVEGNRDDLHTALARLYTGRRRPTENEVYKTVKNFRDWLSSRKPPNWSRYKADAERILDVGKSRSDDRIIEVANVGRMLQKQGVPEDVIQKVLGYTGMPAREIPVAMAAIKRKGRGRMRPMFS